MPGVNAGYTDIDEMNLDVDTTIPLGLILNELITNVVKYAFVDREEGRVDIRLKHKGKELLLEVEDNGVGIQDSATGNGQSSGFGMKMIETFSKKLDAEHQVISDNGTLVRMIIRNFKLAS